MTEPCVIDGLLDHMNPFPGQNSVVIMDNCCIHHAQAIQEMIEEQFVVFVYFSFHIVDQLPVE